MSSVSLRQEMWKLSSPSSSLDSTTPPTSLMDFLDRFTLQPRRPETKEGSSCFHDNSVDIYNPKTWPRVRKWLISAVSILLVINATLASSGPSAVLPSLSSTFDVSEEAAGLTVTVFLLAYAGGPLFWAPLSEHYGRRWVFYAAFMGYFVFNFLCAFAPNFGGMLGGRFLSGFFASSTIANCPGLLVDIWDPVPRGNAMALFTTMVFIGPSLGPVVAGLLQLKKDWRWVFYVLLWFSAGSLPFLFMIPETLSSQLARVKARDLRKHSKDSTEEELADRSLGDLFKVALVCPWRILPDPIMLAVAAYSSLIYALLYMLFAIYPIVFRQRRGWNAGVAELPLLGLVVGALIGGMGVRYQTSLDHKKKAAGRKRTPEDRLPLAMVGGLLFPVAMFWLAWTAEYNSTHWVVPILAGVPLATSFLLISTALLNYVADSYMRYAASGLAANAICRSLCGAATPLFTTYMFKALSVAGGGSLIAGLGCLLAPIPFVFYRYGGRIRARSKFASSLGDQLNV